MLSPHGHVEHHAVVADDGDHVWLDVEPGTAGALLDFLNRMRFLMRVEPADVTAELGRAVVWSDRPAWTLSRPAGRAPAAARRVLAPVPGAKFAAGSVPAGPTSRYDVAAIARRRLRPPDAATGSTCWCRVPAVDGVVTVLGRAAGRGCGRSRRCGSPPGARGWASRPTTARCPPRSAGWPAAVHLDKGCYRGQETVARVHNLGRPPRRLVLLHLDGVTTDELPAPGHPGDAPDGRTVGFVGTAVRHYELGADRAGRGQAERVRRRRCWSARRRAIDPTSCSDRSSGPGQRPRRLRARRPERLRA